MTQSQDESSTDPMPYRTSDTPFAAYLHYSGYKIVHTIQDPNDYKREVLLFLLDEGIPALESDWRLGNAYGDLKKFQRSLKIVNRMIYENRKKREEQ
jgi:hypothetical protein